MKRTSVSLLLMASLAGSTAFADTAKKDRPAAENKARADEKKAEREEAKDEKKAEIKERKEKVEAERDAREEARKDAAKKDDTADGRDPDDKSERSSMWKDALLNLKVRQAMLKQLGGDGLRVKVSAEGTTVNLAGSVKDRATMKLAKEVAKSIEGVKVVRSNIELKADKDADDDSKKKELADKKLETEVKKDLMQDLGDRAMKLEVETADGIVSVRGHVPTDELRDRAIRCVRAADGVRDVKNLVDVKSDEQVRQDKLEEKKTKKK